MSIFNSKFVQAVRLVLSARCADAQRVTRDEVCEALAGLGMSVTPKLLGEAVAEGAFNTENQAWGLFRGRYGSIREIDLVAFKNEQKAAQERQERINARIAKAMETKAAKKALRQAAAVGAELVTATAAE
jgi:hypothetical protein